MDLDPRRCRRYLDWPSLKHHRKPARRETIEWMQLVREKDPERKKHTVKRNA